MFVRLCLHVWVMVRFGGHGRWQRRNSLNRKRLGRWAHVAPTTGASDRRNCPNGGIRIGSLFVSHRPALVRAQSTVPLCKGLPVTFARGCSPLPGSFRMVGTWSFHAPVIGVGGLQRQCSATDAPWEQSCLGWPPRLSSLLLIPNSGWQGGKAYAPM